MSSAETYIEDLIYECDCIIRGDYGEETQQHVDDLMIEMEGFSFPLRVTGCLPYLKYKNIDGVKRIKGWLRCNMATLTGSPSTNVSANLSNVGNSSSTSNAIASASNAVTISQAIEAVENDPSLTDEQKAKIQMLLAEAKSAATKGDKGLFAKAGSKILGAVEQAAPALIVKVLEFLVSQATGLGA